jgi:septum formation protein
LRTVRRLRQSAHASALNDSFHEAHSRFQPPRRREILRCSACLRNHRARTSKNPSSHRPVKEEVLDFAVGKAQSVAKNIPDGIVIGSDTMIVIDGEKIGKPSGRENARRMLRALSGKAHRIYTGVAILDVAGGAGLRSVEEVSVKMRPYTGAEIESYLTLGESLDKAGAYSIQGAGRVLIESIEGDYLAAVGLPLKPIAGYLANRGISFPLNVETLYAEKSFRNWRDF